MHGRDSHGWLASCLSVAKLPMRMRRTASATPCRSRRASIVWIRREDRQAVKVLDTYCGQGGFHMNLNVLNRDTLLDAMEIRTSTRS